MTPPIRQANGYARRLVKLAKETERAFKTEVLQAALSAPGVRIDVAGPQLAEGMDRFKRLVSAIWLGADVQKISNLQSARIEAWSGRNLARVLTINAEDLPVISVGQQWLTRQQRLARDLADEYTSRVAAVLDAAPVGIRAGDLAAQLEKAVGFGRERARLIAVNETLTLAAETNERRQKSLGIGSYRWSTSDDVRVRDNHEPLDGKIYRWDSPPLGGGTGPTDSGHPGSGIRCRCLAAPFLE